MTVDCLKHGHVGDISYSSTDEMVPNLDQKWLYLGLATSLRSVIFQFGSTIGSSFMKIVMTKKNIMRR